MKIHSSLLKQIALVGTGVIVFSGCHFQNASTSKISTNTPSTTPTTSPAPFVNPTPGELKTLLIE